MHYRLANINTDLVLTVAEEKNVQVRKQLYSKKKKGF